MDELTALELSSIFAGLVISRSIEKATQQIGSLLSGILQPAKGKSVFDGLSL
jgi:hypothetical protein